MRAAYCRRSRRSPAFTDRRTIERSGGGFADRRLQKPELATATMEQT